MNLISYEGYTEIEWSSTNHNGNIKAMAIPRIISGIAGMRLTTMLNVINNQEIYDVL